MRKTKRIHKVAVLSGDGIGPEVTDATLRILNAVQESLDDLEIEFIFCNAGYYCISKYGTNVPTETIETLRNTEACLKGPMTTPEDPNLPPSAAVTIRKTLDLYANVRYCRTLPNVKSLNPSIDLVVLRENTEGLYFGQEFEVAKGKGVALRVVTSRASERIARLAFKIASNRKKHVTCVHKRNILRLTDGIFRDSVFGVAKEYPHVKLDEVHIDAMAMRLIKDPEKFDVIVTTNMFGDIISDESAQAVGGLGLVAGANLGEKYGMFEPVHGSAPKYSGKNKVNPIAMIMAGKMMMEYLRETKAAALIEQAVVDVLREKKVRTYDLGGKASTVDMSKAIAEKILDFPN